MEVQIDITIGSIDSRNTKFNAVLVQCCLAFRLNVDHVALFVLRSLFVVDPVHQRVKGVHVFGEVQHAVARTTELIQDGLNWGVLFDALFLVVENAT